jgi:hypothetical protein
LPDWIEHWSRDSFKKVGYGLALSVPVLAMADYPACTLGLACGTAVYWAVGLNDIKQTNQAALVRAFVETGEAPDFITIDGTEGGTGAAPPEFSNNIGMPLSFGLSYAHAMLVGVGLRDPVDKSQSKVTLIGSGKVISGFSM